MNIIHCLFIYANYFTMTTSARWRDVLSLRWKSTSSSLTWFFSIFYALFTHNHKPLLHWYNLFLQHSGHCHLVQRDHHSADDVQHLRVPGRPGVPPPGALQGSADILCCLPDAQHRLSLLGVGKLPHTNTWMPKRAHFRILVKCWIPYIRINVGLFNPCKLCLKSIFLFPES